MNTLPNEIFISFMFPVMTIKDLLRLSQTNSHLNELITIFLHHCSGGRLIADDYYGLSDLYKLAQTYPQYKNLVIEEITTRLASTKKRELVLPISTKYIMDGKEVYEYDLTKNMIHGIISAHRPFRSIQDFEEGINTGRITNLGHFSDSRFISLEYILQHPEINWRYDNLVNNPNITVDFFLSSYDFYEPNIITLIEEIATNPAISRSDYEKIWHKYEMACIDMSENIDISKQQEWYFANPNLSVQNIRDYLNNKCEKNNQIISILKHNYFNTDVNYIYLAQKIISDLIF